jgi:hypothetical protein
LFLHGCKGNHSSLPTEKMLYFVKLFSLFICL